jgi:hypothetical protein
MNRPGLRTAPAPLPEKPMFACSILSLLLLGADPATITIGKLSAPTPAGWVAQKVPNRLRSYQFQLPSADAAFAPGEVIVLPESNPDPAKSFPRWRASFVIPETIKPEEFGTVQKFAAGPATVHLLELTGTWNYQDRPVKPTVKEQRPDWRVLWAIIVQDDEATHVRLAGPRVVVEKWQPDFMNWLKSLK